MAVKYFDLNGTTAGFGTLTGAWNTSSAFWSDSSAGTAAPAAYTFTNQDTAQFGFAGTSATAGTATIAASLNVTVNQIVTANLAGAQTIAAGASGTLTLAGTTPTITVGSAGGLTISAPINGTGGFTKAGANALTLTGSLAGLTGTISMDQTVAGYFTLQNTPYTSLVSGTTFSLTGPANYGAAGNRTLLLSPTTSTSTLNSGVAFSGTGAVQFEPTVAAVGAGHTFPAGAFASLTGTSIPSTTGFVAASAGFAQSLSDYNSATCIVTAADLPSVYSFYFYSAANVSNTRTLNYNGAAATYGTRLDLVSAASTSSTMSANLYANQASGTLTLTGGISRYETSGQTRTITLTLRGTGELAISGDITQPVPSGFGSGVIALTKADSNRVILSGANTYTGATTISGGFLQAASAAALGSSTTGAVTVASGATLEFSGSVTVNKASVATNLTGGGVTNVSGDNTYSGATSPMTASTTFTATAGSLSWSPTLSGGFPVIKAGSGTIKLNNTANTYTGTTTINVGTLEVTKLALVATNSSIGAPILANATISMAAGTTLKHTGTGTDSTDRIISVSSAGSLTLDSSDATNTGSVNFTTGGTVTWTNGANTLVLSGTNTNTGNTFARTLADTTGTTSITKSGAGYWKLPSTMTGATGPVTVSAGTLDLGSTANRTFGGTLAIAGGTLTNGAFTIQPTTSITASGGTVTSVLTGTGVTFTATSGTTSLQPNNASKANTITGAVTIQNTATVDLVANVAVGTGSNGKVLGTGDVTVQSGGTIRTSATGLQAGQARYNNLTFNGGSTLRIGFAA